jgi:hypothetical protein
MEWAQWAIRYMDTLGPAIKSINNSRRCRTIAIKTINYSKPVHSRVTNTYHTVDIMRLWYLNGALRPRSFFPDAWALLLS